MLKDVTLGQYFPGNTVIHRLDPRTKLILVIVYIVALFTAKSYISYAVVIAVFIICVIISRIGLKSLFSGLKPILIIIIITAILNILFTRTGRVLVQFWKITITADGVRIAVFMVVRLMLLIMGTFNFVAFRSVRTNADLILDLMANNGGDFPDRIPEEEARKAAGSSWGRV